MNLESQIKKLYGKVFTAIPGDGLYRKFKVGADECFAISFGTCAAFGNHSKNELFEWDGQVSRKITCAEKSQRLSAQELAKERAIVVIGNSMQDSGTVMGEDHHNRYILALCRVIEFDGRQ